ncbi:MAG TPA: DUF3857 domain-containing protein [Flavobacterium sp.]|nr:DUF3857 domain-containing protein [Flavobacterium sp.]
MKKLLLLFTIVLYSLNGFPQKKIDLNIKDLDSKLFDNTNLYITIDKTEAVEIKSQTVLTYEANHTYLIRNKKDLDRMDLSTSYDNLVKIKHIQLRIYDQNGKLRKTIKDKDFNDKTLYDGFSIYLDNRLKYYQVKDLDFPYFIQFEYKTEQKNTLSIPAYTPCSSSNELVLNSHFSLKYPENFSVKAHEINLEEFQINKSQSLGEYKYSAANLTLPEYEPYNYSYQESLPIVRFSSEKFALDNVKGTANDWNDFAKWYYTNLLEPVNSLPPEAVKEIQELTKNAGSKLEKAKIVYQYVQNNTRYVSVQIGLGGWMPIPAKKVYESKYSDCKGLVNYTQALLRAVGVPAYYTVIYASENIRNINQDIITLQGNHAILTLPTDDGTYLLECTNPDIAFGNIDNQLTNRNAFVIEENKGYFINTNDYFKKDNNLEMKFDAKFDIENNKMATKITIENSGYFYNQSYRLHKLNDREKEKYVKNLFSKLNNVSIKSSSLTENDLIYTENYKITSNSPMKVAGRDLLLTLNPFYDYISVPQKVENRKSNFSVFTPKKYVFDINYEIPDEFAIDYVPNDISLQTDFGNFTLTVMAEDRQIHISQKLELYAGNFRAEQYDAYRKFITDILLTNEYKFILKNSL